MDKQLTAGQALATAGRILELGLDLVTRDTEAGKVTPNDDVIAMAAVAQALSTYALAMVHWDGTLDVRARVESGV